MSVSVPIFSLFISLRSIYFFSSGLTVALAFRSNICVSFHFTQQFWSWDVSMIRSCLILIDHVNTVYVCNYFSLWLSACMHLVIFHSYYSIWAIHFLIFLVSVLDLSSLSHLFLNRTSAIWSLKTTFFLAACQYIMFNIHLPRRVICCRCMQRQSWKLLSLICCWNSGCFPGRAKRKTIWILIRFSQDISSRTVFSPYRPGFRGKLIANSQEPDLCHSYYPRDKSFLPFFLNYCCLPPALS